MHIITGPKKNEIINIEPSSTKTNRLLIGLGWDALPNKGLDNIGKYRNSRLWLLGSFFSFIYDIFQNISNIIYAQRSFKKNDYNSREKNYAHYDLDLHGYIYDENLEFICELGPANNNTIDESLTIYHSGEDYAGIGDNDDEVISIETKNIPDQYHHFLFVVKSDSKHKLKSIPGVKIRLADGKTNKEYGAVLISPSDAEDNYTFIYCHLFKQEGKWQFKTIGEYTDFDQDWPNYLKEGAVPDNY